MIYINPNYSILITFKYNVSLRDGTGGGGVNKGLTRGQ